SIRTLPECLQQAADDISTATAMLECRLLVGDADTAEQVRDQARAAWPERAFFEAKRDEQNDRHNLRGDSEYSLEPNVKASPGGLRDLHTLIWITGRLGLGDDLETLLQRGFLREREFSLLLEAHEFLAATRFALHKSVGRAQNRLLFEHQAPVASMLGFSGDHPKQQVEAFMQRYYLMVMRVNEFNEVLLQQIAESLYRSASPDIIEINSRFQMRDNLLEVTHEQVFEQQPQALMELFALLADNPAIIGISAETTRLVYRSRHLIDESFRSDLRVISHFMEILRRPQRLTDILRRMRLYGVLSNYIPTFGNVMGLMQHDLFHIFTVDAHTIHLVNHLTSFWTGELAEQYPIVTDVTQRIPKIELLLLAGLFHDLGKGRGGDHSEIGAPEAEEFCLRHWLSAYDARLVAWLVRHHLTMSTTAQRKDITDPDVIHEFAALVGSLDRLDYLFALTVADISATNPELWNAWRASLLSQLYRATQSALRRGLDHAAPSLGEMIQDTRTSVAARLEVDSQTLADYFEPLGVSYFAQHSVDEIEWHTRALMANPPLPLVLTRNLASGTQVFVCGPDRNKLFAAFCRILDQGSLTVVDARVCTSDDGRVLDSFMVLDATDMTAVSEPARIERVCEQLRAAFDDPTAMRLNEGTMTPRVKRYFNDPTHIAFYPDRHRNRTVMELVSPDRPGLLARVAGVLDELNLDLVLAKIATLGERVEDHFYIVNAERTAVEDPAVLDALKTRLQQELDEHA
ncbi:MAG: [protein-PII] uridylyltransferase, partial [Litorivicinus sp.]